MDEITLDDHTYISSKRASELTGYTKDYVGQLCREGRVEAKQIGRNWYVLETSIKAHRFGTESEQTTARISAAASGVDAFESPWKAPVYESVISSPLPALAEKPSVNEFVNPTEVFADEAPVVPTTENAPAAPEALLEAGTAQEVTPVMEAPVEPILAAERAPVSSEVISQMESAWKDWFKGRQANGEPNAFEETLIESPEIIDAREYSSGFDESEQVVSFHKQYEEKEQVSVRQNQQYQQNTDEFLEEPLPVQREVLIRREQSARNPFEIQPSRARFSTPSQTKRELPSTNHFQGRGVTKFRNEVQHEGRILHERTIRRTQKSSAVLKIIFITIAIIAAAIAVIGTGKANQFISDSVSRIGVIQYLNGQDVVNNK